MPNKNKISFLYSWSLREKASIIVQKTIRSSSSLSLCSLPYRVVQQGILFQRIVPYSFSLSVSPCSVEVDTLYLSSLDLPVRVLYTTLYSGHALTPRRYLIGCPPHAAPLFGVSKYFSVLFTERRSLCRRRRWMATGVSDRAKRQAALHGTLEIS